MIKKKLLFVFLAFLVATNLVSAITKDCLKNDILIPELQKYYEGASSAFSASELRKLLDLYAISGGETSVSIETSSISDSAKATINSKCSALLKNLGEVCAVGPECKTGVCKNYKCAPESCSTNADCNSGEKCTAVERGFLKSIYDAFISLFGGASRTGESICLRESSSLKGSGQDCQASAECESDFCVSKKCGAQPCTDNNECQTGACAGKEVRSFSNKFEGFVGGGAGDTMAATSFINEVKAKYAGAQITQKRACEGSNSEGSVQNCMTTVTYTSCTGLGY